MKKSIAVVMIAAAALLLARPAFGQVTIHTGENAQDAPSLEEMPLREKVSSHGITWTFEEPVPAGQFVNGDWYVVGPVTIADIDPRPLYDDEVEPVTSAEERLERRARHGAVLNTPLVSNRQGFDSRDTGRYEPVQSAHLPIGMQPGDALLSAISADAMLRVSGGASPIAGYAVLTCVGEPLPPDAFRPSYADHRGATGEQKIFLARDLRREMLPRLPRPDNTPDIAGFAERFSRPCVDIVFFGRASPPYHRGYGRATARATGHGALLLTLDFTDAEKEPLLINLLQYGIDLYGMVRGGHRGWPAHGGWGSGRKLPIVLAGALLGDDDMARVTEHHPEVMFQENDQTAHDDCWTGAGVVYTGHVGHRRAFAERRTNLGWGPYEHLHPTRWTGWIGTSYRGNMTSNTWVGTALAVRILQLEDEWGHDAFLDYCDRWMHEPDPGYRNPYDLSKQGNTYDNPLFKAMWDAWREDLPPIAGETGPPRPPAGWKVEREYRGPEVETDPELRVGDSPFFPVMIRAEHPGRIGDALSIGANVLVGGCFETPQNFRAYYRENIRNDDFLDALAEHGLYGVFGADARTIGHPALLGWTHVEEPDVVAEQAAELEGRERRSFSPATHVMMNSRGHGFPPELKEVPDHLLLVEPAYRWMRDMDEARPVLLTLGRTFQEAAVAGRTEFCRDYLRYGDMFGITLAHSATPGEVNGIVETVAAMAPDKPLFAWIATRVEGETPASATDRIRAQAEAALEGGAAGIGYCGFEGLDMDAGPAPELLEELARLNEQLLERANR